MEARIHIKICKSFKKFVLGKTEFCLKSKNRKMHTLIIYIIRCVCVCIPYVCVYMYIHMHTSWEFKTKSIALKCPPHSWHTDLLSATSRHILILSFECIFHKQTHCKTKYSSGYLIIHGKQDNFNIFLVMLSPQVSRNLRRHS